MVNQKANWTKSVMVGCLVIGALATTAPLQAQGSDPWIPVGNNVYTNGWVGIGRAPQSAFDLYSTSAGGGTLFNVDGVAGATGYRFVLRDNGVFRFWIAPTGVTQIAAVGSDPALLVNYAGSNPIAAQISGGMLHLYDSRAASPSGQNLLTLSSDYLGSTPGSGGRVVFKYYAGGQEAADIRGYTFGPGATGLAFGTGFGAVTTRMVIDNSGNVGVGVTAPSAKMDVNGSLNVNGNATFSGTVTGGNIVAKYQDVAEWVPTTEELSAGSVVVLDDDQNNHVLASRHAYDTSVAGVVSAQPGIVLGEAATDKAKVATTGRVKIKVDASRPIRIGDLLVTSDVPGTAMRSEPIDVAGAKIHRPGTIIGKALEPLDHGKGEILALLTLQ